MRGTEGTVLLGYLHPNELSASFHRSLLDLIAWDQQNGRFLGHWAAVKCQAGGVPEGRNQVAEAVMKAPDLEWLFFVDSDMGFAPDTLDRLLAVADPAERPIVGGLCFAQREQAEDGMGGWRCVPRPTIFDYVDLGDGNGSRFTGRAHYPVNQLVRCAGTGAACLLIHRSVLERIGSGWFDRLRGTDGSLLGEDISFCVRAGAAGAPIFVHTGIRTTHQKTLWLGEPDFWQWFTAPPASAPVDVIVPVLHRPQNVEPFMSSLLASTGRATAWWVIEPGDAEVSELVQGWGGRIVECPGTFAQKVNYAHGLGRSPWMLLVGDDVQFRAGWLDQAEFVGDKYEANVVGTNDLGNPRTLRGEHSPHPLIRRSYVEEVGASWDGPGVVCHEGYRHWYVDDEIVTAAKQRGVWQMAAGSVVEHMHPLFGKAQDDDVYRLGQAAAKKDQATFSARYRQNRAA